jgi:hypothetical protein
MVSLVVDEDWTIKAAAAAFQTSPKTCGKWVSRYRASSESGLLDHSSAPHCVANRTDERAIQAIAALRRLRFTGAEIAELLDRPLSTISGILTRIGMGRLGRLGLEPAQRYERARPGELIHVDVKKLGRIVGGAGKRVRSGGNHYTGSYTDAAGTRRGKAGWECVHVAIDDATRLAYAEVLADEKAGTAVGFLRRAIAFYRRHGIHVERVMTDGCCFYVKSRVPVGVLQWIVTLRVRRVGVLVGMVVAGSGWSRCQTRRARWRLRQRIASRRVLPSACLRAR